MRLLKRNNLNYALILPIFLLYLLSVGVQYGASIYDGKDAQSIVLKQLVFCFLSFLGLLVTSMVRTTVLLRFSGWIYVFSLGIMSLLYWFYDEGMFLRTGTKRWLRIGSFSFQPSELAKLAFILFMVYLTLLYEQKCTERTIQTDLRYIGKILLFSLPTFLLMFMQKDFGTSLVFVVVLGALFVISGVDWRILSVIFLVFALIGATLIMLVFTEWGNDVLYALHFKPYQLDRVRAWIDPFAYKDSIAYQQVQSILSIGSGGLTGRSSGTSPVYVPVRESDMIFTVIGESFGFFGSASVLLLYFYLFYQIIFTAIRSNNKGALYIAVTFVFSLVFQIFENIGAAIGLLPLTGIPLPFLSQGGTSLIVIGCGLGIIFGLQHEGANKEAKLAGRSLVQRGIS